MRQKHLLIAAGIILGLIIFILVLLSISFQKNNTTSKSTNKLISPLRPSGFEGQTTSFNQFQRISTNTPPNGAIENITPTIKSQKPSLESVLNSPTPTTKVQISNIKDQRLNTPTPTKRQISTNYNQLQRIITITPPKSGSVGQTFFDFDNSNSENPNTSSPPNTSLLTPNQYQYFSQCDGDYDNYSLPQGCNICESGCGPTTVAMILSTYLGKTYTPADVVEIYKENGFFAGCIGTKMNDAQTILNQKGLQTTDFMMLTPMTKEDAIVEMKKYILAGWTIFTLGRYCATGCSHYFWVTKIDANNKVWSYDPYYNKDIPPPLDVSNYDPYPEYRIAFGVKK